MLDFEKIQWKNLLSTGNKFTTINFKQNKNTLIVGINGSGKSTILDALMFVLFNKPYRKINKPQLVNSINKKGLLVELFFSSGSKKYKIVRGIKPNIFEIYVDGNLLNQDADSKDYQEHLEKKIIGMNQKSFQQVVILGSSNYIPFMQLPLQHRREIIEDLLDVEIFSVMNIKLKNKILENKEKIDKINYSIDLQKEKIKIQKINLENNKNDKKEELLKKEENLNNVISRLAKNIDIEKNLKEELKKDEKIKEYYLSLKDKEQSYIQYRKQIDEKLKKLEKNIEFFDKNDVCPTCNQNIEFHFKENHIQSKQKKKEEFNKNLSSISLMETKNKKLIEETEKQLRVVEKKKNLLNDIQSEVAIDNRLKTIILSEIEAIKQEKNNISKQNNLLNEMNTDLKKMESVRQELIFKRSILDTTNILLKDGGIKSKIIKQYIPIMNKFINKYLASMDFFISLEMDENFEEKIRSRYRDDFSYSSFSEGEKRRIDLAILFAWREIAKLRTNSSCNLLILDEILDGSLDVNGVDSFQKLVYTLPKHTNTFIISHKVDQMVDKFNSILKFEKNKNFSILS